MAKPTDGKTRARAGTSRALRTDDARGAIKPVVEQGTAWARALSAASRPAPAGDGTMLSTRLGLTGMSVRRCLDPPPMRLDRNNGTYLQQ